MTEAVPAKGKVTIYTDGACKGNPGPGGWGVVLKSGDKEKHLYGGETQIAVSCEPLHRLEICHARRYRVDGRLESQGVENCRQRPR